MELEKIYLLPSPDMEQLLSENSLNLEDLLRQEDVIVSTEFAADPAGSSAGTKEPVTIILAAAAVAAAIVPALTRSLSFLSRRPVVVKEMVQEPALDESGKPLVSDDGKPILRWAEKARLLEPHIDPLPKSSFGISGPLGIKISYEES